MVWYRSCLLVLAAVSAVANAQSVRTRWALPLSGTGGEKLIARPFGGVLLTLGSRITAFNADGGIDWVKNESSLSDARLEYGPDGTLHIADLYFSTDYILRLRKFSDDGNLIGTYQVAMNRPYNGTAAMGGLSVSAAGIAMTAATTVFDRHVMLVRLNPGLSVRYKQTFTGLWSAGVQLDVMGNLFFAGSSEMGSATQYTLRKYTSQGVLLYDIGGIAPGLVPLAGGSTLATTSWSNNQGGLGTNTHVIDPQGVTTTVGSDEGRYCFRTGAQVYTYGDARSITRRNLNGEHVWTRDLGFDAQAILFGADPWINSYVMTKTATGGMRLYKLNSAGHTVWYRSGGIAGALSPYSQDIYQFDKATGRIRLYCFQQSPVGIADTFSTTAGQPITKSVAANDKYFVDAQYSLVQPPTFGTCSLGANGSLQYQPNPGFTGTDTLTYSATKPGLTATGPITVTIQVTP